MALSLGISPCPNDTFIFSALVDGRVPLPAGVGPLNLHMADVEELNSLAAGSALDVTKLSVAAAAEVLDDYVLLNSGGALGRGCGPLLVAARPCAVADLASAPIAIPGRKTTGNLLLSLHGAFNGPRREMLFDAIMPAVSAGELPVGVVIHEGRFTYADRGLHLVLDLGAWWEETMRAPLPLGVIAARRSLGADAIQAIDRCIHDSLALGRRDPLAGRDFVRAHAQEMDEAVLSAHIATFVNEFSLDLGREGRDAVRAMLEKAAELAGGELPQGKALFAPEL